MNLTNEVFDNLAITKCREAFLAGGKKGGKERGDDKSLAVTRIGDNISLSPFFSRIDSTDRSSLPLASSLGEGVGNLGFTRVTIAVIMRYS